MQHESPFTSGNKVMAKVKVFVHTYMLTPTGTRTPGLCHKLPGLCTGSLKITHLLGSKFVATVFSFIIHTENQYFMGT